jgi:hypothetical protein
MSTLEKIEFSPEALQSLRREFFRLSREVTPFSEVPKFAAQIASLGIAREVGTVNDELARFIFVCKTGEPVARGSLKAELVRYRDLTGVRIYSDESARLELRARHLSELLHPHFSFNTDGSVKQLVLFPEIIAAIARRQGVEPVLVKTWGKNSLFGGFDPAKGYYQTNFWELENNDALLFSGLVSQNHLAFLGTHDLIAHLAGVEKGAWGRLVIQATKVNQSLRKYFSSAPAPAIASLILPYTIGVVLDDLAQPPSYDSKSHLAVLDHLLLALDERQIDPSLRTILTKFPAEFQTVIDLSRTSGVEVTRIEQAIAGLVRAIKRHAVGQSPNAEAPSVSHRASVVRYRLHR